MTVRSWISMYPVAIVAGENEECVDKALKIIKVQYEVLPAILDFHKAKDNEILVHPEENWKALCPVGADNKRNLVATGTSGYGDVEAVFKDCEVMVEETYHVKADQQAMMETFRTCCFMDAYGRLNVVSSTQIVFHVPRIGGGFGAKQSVVAEVFPAFVTWKTGKPSMIIYSRQESQTASSPRHEMEVTVRLGAMKNGKIRAIDVYTLSNSGAYGEHGPTTVGLSGHKSIPLYEGSLEAHRFSYDVVYSNVMSAGAYRGYGATQGQFAVQMHSYYDEVSNSCALDRCLERAAKMIGWEDKYPARDMGNGKVRSVGMAMSMQGSGISGVDVGSADIKLNEDGIYTLAIGAADMGTGCDTILAQMVAECMMCPIENVIVSGADTDTSPYDSGSYASSTTYITGSAVEKACRKLQERIVQEAAKILN